MSMKVHAIGRTARIIKPYAVTQRDGRNGAFESRMVMFSLATDRDYKQSVTNADGTITQERHTDFFACRATGPIADLFNQYCSANKVDENGQNKLVSRRIAIEGHLEKYQATRKEQIQANVGGQIVTLAVDLPEEREVVVIESIEFLDANPVNQANAQAQATTATVVATATQNAQSISATPVVNNATPVVNGSIPVVNGAVSEEVAPF